MADAKPIKKRPGTMHLLDATQYRLPPAGWVSILHRVSGLILIILMPFVIWMFDTSLSSEVTFDQFRNAFVGGIGFVPAFVVKLAALALIWGFLQHFCAGVRHLFMDVHVAIEKDSARHSAAGVLAVSLALTAIAGLKLFGVF